MAGVRLSQQRLIFCGQLLHYPQRSLQQLGIAKGDTVHLIVGESATGAGSESDSLYGSGDSEAGATTGLAGSAAQQKAAGEDQGPGAAGGGAGSPSCSSGGGDVMMVSTVADVQDKVAAGAGLLALYVEEIVQKD